MKGWKFIMKYLGVTLDTIDHMYKYIEIIEESDPTDVLYQYISRNSNYFGNNFRPSGIFDIDEGGFKYHDDNRFVYFIRLPDEHYNPDVLHIHHIAYVPKFVVGDTLYLTRTEQELRYHGCGFRPETTDIPIERTIISINITRDGVKYQLSGCGVHINESDIGKIAYTNYEDAAETIRKRYDR